MRISVLILTVGASLLLGGCGDKDASKGKPTFMFWCFRDEVVSSEYHIPEMMTPAAASYIQGIVKRDPGYVESSYDLDSRTLTVKYYSSRTRKMNYEEAIAFRGFAVNNRPAREGAKLPQGLN